MIKLAAIKRDDKIWTGKRHYLIIRQMIKDGCSKPIFVREQGFVTDTGEWVDREKAYEIAVKCNQEIHPHQGASGILFSEYLKILDVD